MCGWTVLHIEISVGPQQLLKLVKPAHLSASAVRALASQINISEEVMTCLADKVHLESQIRINNEDGTKMRNTHLRQ